MKDQSLYLPMWQKYQQILAMQMKNAASGPKDIQLFKNEFLALGKRPLADYVFELEVENSQVLNNINGKAIARDLLDVLNQHSTARSLLSNQHYLFSMGKDLNLKVTLLPATTEVAL